jgi:hypothetical protein
VDMNLLAPEWGFSGYCRVTGLTNQPEKSSSPRFLVLMDFLIKVRSPARSNRMAGSLDFEAICAGCPWMTQNEIDKVNR